MGNPKGFLNIKKGQTEYRPVCERIKDYREVVKPRPETVSRDQASRCMDCGTPFCHWGCPLGNYIPEWNDLVWNDQWERALELLYATNNLPEVTGRICPAPCEYACVLGINDDPVTIRENELAIIEQGYKRGWIKPHPPETRTGKKVAVIGSGPAGWACADQLNQAGHRVTVFEKDDQPGGMLRYGIPDFKLEKSILDRRLAILKKEGIEFLTKVEASVEQLRPQYDAIVLAGGARVPRDLKIPGRELKGIHFAMEYLTQKIDSKGKRVVVIGGGDTGADCVGTANRQGASCVVQIEILPRPSESRPANQPWPVYPLLLKVTSSHEEGCERQWSVATKEFKGLGTRVQGLKCVKVDCELKEIPGSEFIIEADLVILALGFLKPDIKIEDKGVLVAGDMRRGPSLVVWAIAEGRRAAHDADEFLMGRSNLPLI